MISPITLRRPIFKMLFMINSVAIEEALQKLLPVIAICRNQEDAQEVKIRQVNNFQSVKKLLPLVHA